MKKTPYHPEMDEAMSGEEVEKILLLDGPDLGVREFEVKASDLRPGDYIKMPSMHEGEKPRYFYLTKVGPAPSTMNPEDPPIHHLHYGVAANPETSPYNTRSDRSVTVVRSVRVKKKIRKTKPIQHVEFKGLAQSELWRRKDAADKARRHLEAYSNGLRGKAEEIFKKYCVAKHESLQMLGLSPNSGVSWSKRSVEGIVGLRFTRRSIVFTQSKGAGSKVWSYRLPIKFLEYENVDQAITNLVRHEREQAEAYLRDLRRPNAQKFVGTLGPNAQDSVADLMQLARENPNEDIRSIMGIVTKAES